MRTIIFFVLFFCYFNSIGHCQTTQPTMTLEQCLKLECPLQIPESEWIRTYVQATDHRSQCSAVLRKASLKEKPAFEKLLCLKKDQREAACVVAISADSTIEVLVNQGVSPSLVALRLLIDLHVGKKSVDCAPLSQIRQRYPGLVHAEFDVSTGELACGQFTHVVKGVIPPEWSIEPSEVKGFVWPLIGATAYSLSGDTPNKGIMCDNVGKFFSFPSSP